MTRVCLAMVALGAPGINRAASNVHPDQAYAWGSNVGWMNWRPDPVTGAQISRTLCSGYLFAANLGWISLGSGAPADGVQYRNDSASDFGVNVVESNGALRGLAYSANAGWISFGETGAPRVDWATGRLSGFAYGANVGWISLGDSSFAVVADSANDPSDTDGDGIPDAWELQYAGNLTTFTATSDFDHDGQTDLEEYLAETNPLDPQDNFRIVEWSVSPDGLSWTLAWTSKPTRLYSVEICSTLESDSWSALGSAPQPPDGPITRRTVPAPASPGFVRVRAVRPSSP